MAQPEAVNLTSSAAAMPDLFALAPSAMVVCHRQGLVQCCNQAFARLVGWPDGVPPHPIKFKDLLTRPSQYILGSQVIPPLHLLGAIEEIEVDIIAADGSARAVLLGAVQMDGPGEEKLHCYALTPIKGRRAYALEQRAARAELQRKERYLGLAEELARVGHWHADLSNGEVFWSPEVYAIHGIDPRTSPAMTTDGAVALFHEDDRDAVREQISQSMESHTPFGFQKRLAATATQGERIVETYGLCEYDSSDNPTGVFGVVRDVTQAQLAKRDLEVSEERYRLLADSVPGMIGYWDKQLRCRFANKAYQEWTRYSPQAIIGVGMEDVAGPELFAANRPHIEGALAGTRQSFERVLTIPTGEVRHAWIQYLPDHGPDGTVRGFYSMITDITGVRERDLAELESNALKTAILSSTQYLVVATTPEGIVTVFNRAAEDALGYTADDIIGKHTPSRWHLPEEVLARSVQLNAELATPIEPSFKTFVAKADVAGSDSQEWTFVRADGTRFPGRLTVTQLRHNDAAVSGYLGVIEDITERRNAEEALRTSEETFRIAMEHASIGMTIIKPNGRWLRVNRALANLLGYSQKALMKLSFSEVTHPDDLRTSEELVRQLRDGQIETYSVEKRYLRKNGETVWAQLSASAVRNPDGSTKYLIAQIQDITERREIERVKNELISTVSHELRTPVTSIRGALGLLAGTMTDELPPKASKLVEIANKNSERLILLVNDMLDIDKIASGKMELDMQRQALGPLILTAIESNQPFAQRFEVSMVTNADAVDLQVIVDGARFQQVMSNLLSNAAKFSPHGGKVEITVEAADETCRVAVTDHGPGIPPSFAPLIFGKFTQADSSATRSKYGSGLGLHITREIMLQMGGVVDFVSEPDQGATFWIELPLAGSD